MQPKVSLPNSQLPATCPYPQPAPTSPNPNIPLPKDLSLYYPPIYTRASQVASFSTKTLYMPLLSLIRTTYPAHLILLHFIIQTILGEEYKSLSSSCRFVHSHHLFSLRPKHSPQNQILKHLPPTFPPQSEQPSFIHMQNNRQNYSFLYDLFKKRTSTCKLALQLRLSPV